MDAVASRPWLPVEPERLSKQFSRLGWLGFWIQFTLLTIPLLLLAYVLLMSSPGSARRIGIDLSNYLSYGSLLVMVFTTFWFFRYTRIGKEIADPMRRPARASVDACALGGSLGKRRRDRFLNDFAVRRRWAIAVRPAGESADRAHDLAGARR
ncbi:DUF3611 family protein [Thiocystis violacea]|uniref:DUF3611 family protein n=1 Tax=Thiocystis violacea TaxID=13725 RepID=UPI0019068C1C